MAEQTVVAFLSVIQEQTLLSRFSDVTVGQSHLQVMFSLLTPFHMWHDPEHVPDILGMLSNVCC